MRRKNPSSLGESPKFRYGSWETKNFSRQGNILMSVSRCHHPRPRISPYNFRNVLERRLQTSRPTPPLPHPHNSPKVQPCFLSRLADPKNPPLWGPNETFSLKTLLPSIPSFLKGEKQKRKTWPVLQNTDTHF